MGALLTEWGDDRDYSNSWTEAGKGVKDWWRNNIGGEVYRENPNAVWDPGDSAWWISHGEGLVESIGEFAITGMGVGSLLGKGAAALSNTMKAGAGTTKFLTGAAQVGTAGTLAYTEGAMSGAQVFKDTYAEVYQKELLQSGNQTEAAKIAKHKAATAAATTVHINTSINTLLNLGSVGPLFRSTNYLASNSVKAAGKKNALRMAEATTRQAGEGIEDLITKASNLQYKSTPIWGSLGREALQEGIEEQVNLFAEQSGKRVGKMEDEEFAKYEYNNWMAYINQFEQLSNFTKDVYTEEGALNFVLGALGGIGQTAVMKNLMPTKVPQRDPNTGQIITDKTTDEPLYKWTNAIGAKKMQEEGAFTRLQTSVVSDLKKFNELSKDLNTLVLNPDGLPQHELEHAIEQKRQELFDLEAYRSIKNGTAEYLKGTFNYIANIDNTTQLGKNQEYIDKLANINNKIEEELDKPEAEQNDELLNSMQNTKKSLESAMANPQMTQAIYEGYAEAPGTDLHKKRAEKAIEEIDDYTRIYHDVMSRYNYGDEETAGLAQGLWNLKIGISSNKRKTERNKGLIERLKEKVKKESSSGLNKVTDTLLEAAIKQAEIEAIEKQLIETEEFVDDVELARKKKTPVQYQEYINSLKAKYPTVVSNAAATKKSNKQLEHALLRREKDELNKRVKDLKDRLLTLEKEKMTILENENASLGIFGDQSKDQLDLNIAKFNEEINKINGSIDNKFKEYYEGILKNELDNEILTDEYIKISSSKGRKEFVANSKAFHERMRALAKEEEAKAKKEEAKAEGLYTVDEVDGKFNVVDKDDKVIATFDTKKEAEDKVDELNKGVKEANEKKEAEAKGEPPKEEDKVNYDYKATINYEEHARNITFLEDLFNPDFVSNDTAGDEEDDIEKKVTEKYRNIFESHMAAGKAMEEAAKLALNELTPEEQEVLHDSYVKEEEIRKGKLINALDNVVSGAYTISYNSTSKAAGDILDNFFKIIEGSNVITEDVLFSHEDKQDWVNTSEAIEEAELVSDKAKLKDDFIKRVAQRKLDELRPEEKEGRLTKLPKGNKIVDVQFKPVTDEISDVNDYFITADKNPEFRININMGPLKDILVVPNNTMTIVEKSTGKEILSKELNPEGAVIFEGASARLFVVANINGQLVPFYQSSSGTSGKNAGKWYPFFGYTGPWLVKGSVDKNTGEMSYSPEIDNVTKLLNENLVFPGNHINRITNTISDAKGATIDMNKFFKINRLSTKEFNVQVGPKIGAVNPGYSIKGLEETTISEESGMVALLTGLNATNLDPDASSRKENWEWIDAIIANAKTDKSKPITPKTESIYTAEEFLNKYLNFEYPTAKGTAKLSFLDKYIGVFKLAQANGVKINIINDPNKKSKNGTVIAVFAKGKDVVINLAAFDKKMMKMSNVLDNKRISELLVHEVIHTLVGDEIKKNAAFAQDLKNLILTMGNAGNLNDALNNITENIKSDIRLANKLPDTADKVKKLNVLKRSLEAIGYVQSTILTKGENIGMEEFITQALSEPEFAFYLNTVPSGNAAVNGPSVSIWQMLKKLVLDLFKAIINDNSKLQELNNILDTHLSKTGDSLDLMNMQKYFDLGTVLEPGIYSFNTGTEVRNIVLYNAADDTVTYSFESELTTGTKRTMSKSEFFNGNQGLNENEKFEKFKNEIDLIDFTGTEIDKYVDAAKKGFGYEFISIYNKHKFDEYIQFKKDQVKSILEDKKVQELLNRIKTATFISGIEEVLKEANKMYKGVDDIIIDMLNKGALPKIKELGNKIDDIDGDNFEKLAKITEFDEHFNPLFVEIEALRNILFKTIFERKREQLKSTSDINELIKIKKQYKNSLNKLTKAFNDRLSTLKNKLKLDNPTLLEEDINDLYGIQQHIDNSTLALLEERLEREFILRLSDDDVKSKGVRYVHLIEDGKVKTGRLWKIAFDNGDSYTVVPDYVDVSKEAEVKKHGKIVSYDEIVDYSEKGSYYKGFSTKEEIFDEAYANSIHFDKIKIIPSAISEIVQIQLILHVMNGIRGVGTEHSRVMSKSATINLFPELSLGDDMINAKKILIELAEKASERDSKGKFIYNDKQIEDEIKKVTDKLIKLPSIKEKTLEVNGETLFSSFINGLKPEEKNNTLGNKVRVKVIKATKAKKLSNKMKSKDKNNIDEKLRIGIIKTNSTKKEAYDNNEEVIGIHSWEDISIDYEINIGSDKRPKWIKVGSARNPYAYKAISRLPHNEVYKSPAHLYEQYIKTENLNERKEILDTFNRLYSIGYGPVDAAKFESIGKAWLQQKKLYDSFSKIYSEQGSNELIFTTEQVKDFMSFDFTGGSFDFTKNPKDRKSLSELEKENKNNPEQMDKFKFDEQGYAVLEVPGKYDKEEDDRSRLSPKVTVDGNYIFDEHINIPEGANYGRYWLAVKDATGKTRFLWVKPKKVDNFYILENFLKPLVDKIKKYNNDIKGKTKEEVFKLKEDFQTEVQYLYYENIYFSLPTIPGYKTKVRFNPFDKGKDEFTMDNDGNYQMYISIVSEYENEDREGVTPSHTVNFSISTLNDNTSVELFKTSLLENSNRKLEKLKKEGLLNNFSPISENNIRMAFPKFDQKYKNLKFKNMTHQQMIAEVFELPVTERLFRGNRLITTVSEKLDADALRDHLYGKKEEVEEKTEDVELLLKDLTPDERKLYDEVRDMEMGFEAATLIINKNNAELLSKNNNITIKNTAKVLNRTQKEAKVILDLLVDLGFLTRNINVYNFVDNYVYPEIGEEIEKVDETTEEPPVEETGDMGGVDTSFINEFNYDDMMALYAELIMENNTDDFSDIMGDLVKNSHSSEILQKAINWLKENYLIPEYKAIKAIIDAHQDSKDSNKQGRMTIDQSAISRLIKGCPKFK
jgi:hypothetical protein